MSLDSIVKVSITNQSISISQAGFGVPLILWKSAPFKEKVR
jgi:glucan phosphoethanolaminetransferase (alkaline phosphatase superfamily)